MSLQVRTFSLIFLTIVLLVCIPSISLAQGVTSAAINGQVTDQAGQPMVGANVVATHVPSGTLFGTTARPDGRYNLANLRVGGPYSISASLIGHKKQELDNVTLMLTENRRIDFKLVEEAVQSSEVLITAERDPILNAARTGAATNVTRDRIDR